MEQDKTVSEDKETFNEVIELMKEFNGCNISPLFFYNETGGVEWLELVERLECAYEREMAAKDAEIARLKAELKDYPELTYQYEQSVIDGNRKTMEISDITVRIDLLERALKPVMECDVPSVERLPSVADPKVIRDLYYAQNAVREAQRIMKEGDMK